MEIKEKYGFIDFIETSSKSGHNVEDAVENLVDKITEMFHSE